ncbi:MAG: hypothetical protein V1695_04070, partial [Candidatus Uhrbacteria bacterium]
MTNRNDDRLHLHSLNNPVAFLRQMIALEHLEENGRMVDASGGKKSKMLSINDVRVSISHMVGTSGEFTWDEYLNEIRYQCRFQFQMIGLPRMRKDPVGRYTAINQAMVEHNGELCFPIVPEANCYIRVAEVVVDADT